MQWISIKDKLPEPFEFVLIYTEKPFTSEETHVNGGFITREKQEGGIKSKRWCAVNSQSSESTKFEDVTYWMPLPNQPERSKREDLDCCKKIENLERLRNILYEENIDCGEWFKDYNDILVIFDDLIKQSKMRCSEHCGNTVRDK